MKSNYFHKSSEIIIAGFDEVTKVTSYICFRLITNIEGTIVYEVVDYSMNIKKPLILSFGGDAEVKIFLNGIDSELEKFIYNFFEIALESNIWELVSFLERYVQLDEKDIIKINNSIKEFSKFNGGYIEVLKEELAHWKTDWYDPLFKITGSLPDDLLIDFTISLINLTSNKRKYSLDVENVGGDIGILLINFDGVRYINSRVE